MASNGRKIQEQILALLGSADYRPLDKRELVKALGRKSGVRMGLNQVPRDLERAGEIAWVSSSWALRIRRNARSHCLGTFTQVPIRCRQRVNSYGDSSEQSRSPRKSVLRETPHVCH